MKFNKGDLLLVAKIRGMFLAVVDKVEESGVHFELIEYGKTAKELIEGLKYMHPDDENPWKKDIEWFESSLLSEGIRIYFLDKNKPLKEQIERVIVLDRL